LFATVAPKKLASQELDASVGASGPHDFAVRFRAARLQRQSVHRIPYPTFVTIAKRPSRGSERRVCKFDLGEMNTEIFLQAGLDS
jgi:hypothetical protein